MRIDKEFEELQKFIDKLRNQSEKIMVKNYKEALNSMRTELGQAFSKYERDGMLTYAEMIKYGRIMAFQKILDEIVLDVTKKNSIVVQAALKNIYVTSYNNTREIVQNATNRTIRGLLKDDIIHASLQNPISGLTLNKRLEVNRANIIVNTQQQITQGLVRGESYKTMADRLKGSLENNASKSMRIVRTESHRVMEDSKLQSLTNANSQGVKMTKTWMSSQDERVRQVGEGGHTRMDGQTIAFDEDFYNSETEGSGKAPGQMGTAEDDINCRCIFIINIE